MALQKLYRHLQPNRDPTDEVRAGLLPQRKCVLTFFSDVRDSLLEKHRALIRARRIEERKESDVDERRETELQGTWPGPRPYHGQPTFKSACWREPVPQNLVYSVRNYAASTENQEKTHVRGGFRRTKYDVYEPGHSNRGLDWEVN